MYRNYKTDSWKLSRIIRKFLEKSSWPSLHFSHRAATWIWYFRPLGNTRPVGDWPCYGRGVIYVRVCVVCSGVWDIGRMRMVGSHDNTIKKYITTVNTYFLWMNMCSLPYPQLLKTFDWSSRPHFLPDPKLSAGQSNFDGSRHHWMVRHPVLKILLRTVVHSFLQWPRRVIG